jgi:hypothetical protein
LSSTRALIERTRQLEKLLYQAKQMTPDFFDHQLGPDVLVELDQLGLASDPVSLTIRKDAEAVASVNEVGPSDPTFINPVSSELIPVTLVHKNPNLGDSLNVVSNLGAPTESEEEKLFRLSVLFLKSLHPSLTQSSEKARSLSAGGPTVRIQPVTEETRCHCKG